jgi:hypothetical protein
MALTITALQRVGGGSCQHFALRIDDDGVLRTVEITPDLIDQVEAGNIADMPFKLVLVLLWMRWKRQHGATLASLVGQTVVA